MVDGRTARRCDAIYCDDVRQEAGNKLSYMGVYSTDMYVSKLPALLPKFCVVIKAVTPIQRPFGPIQFRVTYGDNVLAELDVSPDNPAVDNQRAQEDTAAYVASAIVTLSPFQIEEADVLRALVIDEDGQEFKAFGLRIQELGEAPGS